MYENEESFGIKENFIKFLRNWPVFLITLTITLTAGVLFLKLVPKKHLTTAAILIKDQKKGTEDAQMVQSLNQLASNKIVENEIEVLRSKELLLSVIYKLKLYHTVEVTKYLVAHEVYDNPPFSVEVRAPDSIQKCDPIIINFEENGEKIKIGSASYQLNQWIKSPCGVFRITSTDSQQLQTRNEYTLRFKHPKLVAEELSKELGIYTANKLASVINLSLHDASPKKAEDILNQLLNEYNSIAFKEKNQLANNTLEAVSERLAIASKDLDSIEMNLQSYKSQAGAMDVSSQSKLLLENITDNDQKVADLQRKLRSLRSLQAELTNPNSQLMQAPSAFDVDDKLLVDLIKQLYELEIKYESLLKTTAQNSPIMISIQDNINQLRPVIASNINNQIRSLEQNERSLVAANNRYSSNLNVMPVKEREIIEKSREQNKKTDLYNYLLQKKEEAEMSISSAVPDNRIIDRAVSTVKPVKPKSLIVMGAALIGGLVFAAMIVLLKDSLKSTISEPAQVEKLTGLPVATEIVQHKSSEQLVAQSGARTEIAEQFRHLRSSLPYLGVQGTSNRILVTSSIAKEGKSFIALNLAASLAATGKKVALVEFDLINPTIGKKLNLFYDTGITDYLINKVTPACLGMTVPEIPNLVLIPAGQSIEMSSDLLTQDKMEALIQYLSNEHEIVIIDSAPVGLISDAFSLSNLCSATLFVIRKDITPEKMLKKLRREGLLARLNNVALVYNGSKTKNVYLKDYYAESSQHRN